MSVMESSKMRARAQSYPLENPIACNRNLRDARLFGHPVEAEETSNNRVYSDTRVVRVRDSISGRQGSLTPACGAAWPRRLYYDVYGLIRDILEMSRVCVHARRVTRRWEIRRERLRDEEGPGTARRWRHRGCKDRRAVVRGEWVTAVTCIIPPFPPFISPIPFPPPARCFPSPVSSSPRRQHGSIVRGSINWVSTARPLVPLVLRWYERSSC